MGKPYRNTHGSGHTGGTVARHPAFGRKLTFEANVAKQNKGSFPLNCAQMANRFREYAGLCIAFGENDPAEQSEMLAMAKRWYENANRVERHGRLIAETQIFLWRLDAQFNRK